MCIRDRFYGEQLQAVIWTTLLTDELLPENWEWCKVIDVCDNVPAQIASLEIKMPLRTHQITSFQIKNSNIFWGGSTAPSPNLTPCGEGTSPPHTPPASAPKAPLAPRTQRIWRFSLDTFGISVSSPAILFLNLGSSETDHGNMMVWYRSMGCVSIGRISYITIYLCYFCFRW